MPNTMNSRPLKRQRVCNTPSSSAGSSSDENVLRGFLARRDWEGAVSRVKLYPGEASGARDPSPLALACRLGASFECVKALLHACPSKVRHLLDSRGTPLHEAVVCDESGPDVIELLLTTDVQLGISETRATLMQDVDGYTPLHLLIRRRFQSHVMGAPGESSYLMEILEMLMKSSPEAVVVPDRGEYEEPPIVMALKANVYSPLLQAGEATAARIELHINEMLNCMLRYYPKAASCVFSGYRGKYTALHSAVFHGRCAETIELLIDAERRSPSTELPGLLANTQGEMPLHFCAMRGEPPRSIALVASAAPEAVTIRDASGLTPVHWLWVRFVSTFLAMEDNSRGSVDTIHLKKRENSSDMTDYAAFATLIQGDFETDLSLLRRLDPSVDFLRMRHIPAEVLEESDALHWADRTIQLLSHVRSRYMAPSADAEEMVSWTRMEAVASLFWTKLVSMLRAISGSEAETNREGFSIVRTAFQSVSCPPPVVRIVASLYPEELNWVDANGRLPIHHAARRAWHAWDWPREDGTSEGANAQLLQLESAKLLRTAMDLSPADAAKHKDNKRCLPMHYSMRSFMHAYCAASRTAPRVPFTDIQDLVSRFVKMNPDSLEEEEPSSGLVPFLHASAVAAEAKESCCSGSFPDELGISIVYQLLRENPANMPGSSGK